jgi:hypothetical protein
MEKLSFKMYVKQITWNRIKCKVEPDPEKMIMDPQHSDGVYFSADSYMLPQ